MIDALTLKKGKSFLNLTVSLHDDISSKYPAAKQASVVGD